MKLKIGVFFGGNSVEHEISILTALQAMQHFDETMYEIYPLYLSKKHQIFYDKKLKERNNFEDLDALCKSLSPITIYTKEQRVYLHWLEKRWKKDIEIDMILPIMHGTYGEDGCVQGFLETFNIPYYGSVLASAIGQDKIIMKDLLKQYQLPVIPYHMLHRYSKEEDYQNLYRKLSFPMIVKPASLGSSIAIHIVNNQEELEEAIAMVLHYDNYIIVENYIANMKEYNCSVMGDLQQVQTSVIEEVMKGDAILSYRDKYENNAKGKCMVATKKQLPAQISEEEQEKIEELSKQVFACLRGSGVIRIDFIKDESNQCIYVNEVNTIPGSLAYYLWEGKGISFTQLLNQLIDLTIQKQRRKKQLIYSYKTNILSAFMKSNKLMK